MVYGNQRWLGDYLLPVHLHQPELFQRITFLKCRRLASNICFCYCILFMPNRNKNISLLFWFYFLNHYRISKRSNPHIDSGSLKTWKPLDIWLYSPVMPVTDYRHRMIFTALYISPSGVCSVHIYITGVNLLWPHKSASNPWETKITWAIL